MIFKQSLLAATLVLGFHPAFAARHYVTSAGAGTKDGSSWVNAAVGTDLQMTITAAATGDTVWVACGTYKPTTTTTRSVYFSMKNGVAIYGGFSGTETKLSDRVLSCGSCSILSGEIGVAGNADNSYHVISNTGLDATAYIDGFIIRDAADNRAPTATEGLGGGIYNEGSGTGGKCSPTINNCFIINNVASFGAGIFNNGYKGGNSSPVITNCVIADNNAFEGGGGIDNFGVAGNANPTMTNCIVYNNTAVKAAGGMYCWGGDAGGHADPVILHCAFINNHVTAGDAGGIIADNTDEFGGGSSGSSAVGVRNSIFWGNTVSGKGPQFSIKGTGNFTATYSDIDTVMQRTPHIISGGGVGNIFANPIFINIADAVGTDLCWLTADDGLILKSTSPCINKGDNAGIPSKDILGKNRISATTTDMGPYEYIAPLLPSEIELVSGPGDKAYPNPFTNSISITSTVPATFHLLNLHGQVVISITSADAGTTQIATTEIGRAHV